jgi:hypothetical protein
MPPCSFRQRPDVIYDDDAGQRLLPTPPAASYAASALPLPPLHYCCYVCRFYLQRHDACFADADIDIAAAIITL